VQKGKSGAFLRTPHIDGGTKCLRSCIQDLASENSSAQLVLCRVKTINDVFFFFFLEISVLQSLPHKTMQLKARTIFKVTRLKNRKTSSGTVRGED
jgi:hypothetical protein